MMTPLPSLLSQEMHHFSSLLAHVSQLELKVKEQETQARRKASRHTEDEIKEIEVSNGVLQFRTHNVDAYKLVSQSPRDLSTTMEHIPKPAPSTLFLSSVEKIHKETTEQELTDTALPRRTRFTT